MGQAAPRSRSLKGFTVHNPYRALVAAAATAPALAFAHAFENGPRGNGVIGPLLTDAQRWALVEYLKSIPEEAGRVTPFGAPPNARTGNPSWANVPGAKAKY
jgi:hypothetical protein